VGYKLKDAKITHISLVDKGANGVPFAIIKNAGANAIQKQVRIAKVDDEKRIVKGVVYQPDVPDAHDDQMSEEEIEKAAHLFMENQHTYNIDKQHDLEADKGFVIESYIAPCEMTLGDQTIAKGSWVAAVKVTDDETWEAIKKGEITGFSMWGVGKREKIDESEEEEVSKGVMYHIRKALGLIAKGDVRDKFEQNKKYNNFWTAWNAFEGTIRRYNWSTDRYEFESDTEKAREAIQDFADILQEILLAEDIAKALGKPPASIAKAGRAISAANLQHIDDALSALTELKNKIAPQTEQEEEDEVKTEDIAKAVADAMAPISKQVESLTAEIAQLKKESGVDGGEQPAAGEPAATPEQTALTDAITKALAPITQQMESLASDVQLIKDSRGGTLQPPADGTIEKSEGSVSFSGLL
jgi:hypothetical protein